MPRFLAVTSKGLVEPLYKEIEFYKYKNLKKAPYGVYFESNWKNLYRANLIFKNTSRILLPVAKFDAFTNEELYKKVKKHDFTKYIKSSQTLAVNAKVNSKAFNDRRFVALKIKDAIVDQFRDKFGLRPNVDRENSDLKIYVKVYNNEFSISIDTSGESLSHRGYRLESVTAPLRETLASGILDLIGWLPNEPLLDPMCGSGTFLIEAALRSKNYSPGLLKKSFGFQKLLNYKIDDFISVKSEVQGQVKDANPELYGFDSNSLAIRSCKINARSAGVGGLINFLNLDMKHLKRENLGCQKKGVIIINPPYGERLGDVDDLSKTYEMIASVIKKNFVGWKLWLLSGEPELTRHLSLKSKQKILVYNGSIECRLLCYDIR